ncbi:hypothetical protein CFOL_v3_17585, partial [Cephalotus follicularis]
TEVSQSTCYRARKRANDEIEGSYEEQFLRLKDYGEKIIRSNPSNTFIIQTLSLSLSLSLLPCLSLLHAAVMLVDSISYALTPKMPGSFCIHFQPSFHHSKFIIGGDNCTLHLIFT